MRAGSAALAALLLAGTAAGEERPRFLPLDVVIDAGEERLAAYQIEVSYDSSRAKIVGIEGGEAEGFKPAPYYDRRGMTAGRIVIAAFVSDDRDAPAGRTRVARLHLRVEGDAAPDISIEVITAARPGGGRIEAEAELAEPSSEREDERSEE